MTWNPGQYRRFADERGRPFHDLVRRVPNQAPARVVDLGCGPGDLTLELAGRWPGADLLGIDSSPEMIAAARDLGSRVRFEVADVAGFSAAGADVVVSNACLHWVPGHLSLLATWCRELPPGGSVAFQVPGNHDAPSHRLIRELAAEPEWSGRLTGVIPAAPPIATPAEYAAVLMSAGLSADVWETTYLHVLHGPDPVLEWLRGTALRPVRAALPAGAAASFEAGLALRLREAYPARDGATLLEFRRVFAVGRRS